MIDEGGDQLEEALYQIIIEVWKGEVMPNRWNCENYRPINPILTKSKG